MGDSILAHLLAGIPSQFQPRSQRAEPHVWDRKLLKREKKQCDLYKHVEFVWAGNLRRYESVDATRGVVLQEALSFIFFKTNKQF